MYRSVLSDVNAAPSVVHRTTCTAVRGDPAGNFIQGGYVFSY